MADNSNSRTLTANFTADTSGFSPKIDALVQKLKSTNQEFEKNKVKISELKTEMKDYQNKLAKLENMVGPPTAKQAREMEELREKIAKCATQLGTYNSAQRQLTADMNSLNRELSAARDQFSGTGQAASTFGEVLKANIASEAILGAINKIVDGLRQAAAYCYSTGSAFEAGMSKVAAVSGASADDLERLTNKAKELGASTKFTATEVSEAMNYMAMAGWKTEQMLNGVDGVLGLAAASGTDLATTSDIVTDALTAFGLQAEDCAHFADVLAAASSNANTNVSMMGETFKYCAPIAGALGFKAEDVAVGIGLMANAGVKASNAGTAMRKFMTELSEGLTITGEKIGEVTIQTSNADGTMRSYSDILKELRGVFSQLTDAEKSAAAKDIVGQNAMSGFLAMMNASEADVNKLSDAIRNCDGAAANMAETMEQNVQGAVTKMNSALEGVGISVYDKFKGGLLDAVNIFTETLGDLKTDIDGGELDTSIDKLANSFKNLATESATFIQNTLPGFINGFANALNFFVKFRTEIAGVVTSVMAFKTSMKMGTFITELVNSFKKLATATKTADAAQKGLNATAAATSPLVTAISAGISLLSFALVEFIGHSDSAGKGAEKLRERCEELTQQTAEYKQKCDDLAGIKEQYEEIKNAIDPDIDKTEALLNLQQQLEDQFPGLADKIDLVKDSYEGVVGALNDVIDKTSEAYKISAETTATALEKQERKVSTKIKIDPRKDVGFMNNLNAAINEMTEEELKKFGFGGGGSIGYTIGENFEFKGTYEERLEQMKALREVILSINDGEYKDNNFTLALGEEIGKVEKLREELVAAQNEVDNLNKKEVKSDDDPSSYGGGWRNAVYREQAAKEQAQREAAEKAAEEQRKKDLEAAKKKYDEEKQLADDMYSVGELSAQDYYAKLTELRDQYLEAQTHDWYVATAKIKSYQDQNLKNQKSALSETERAYKKTLAAIDAEIQRHNREKSDAEYEKKIADIEDRMKYGRLDEFEKYELEKERQRVEADREEELFKRSTEDAKAAAKDEYDAQKAYLDAAQSTKDNTAALTEYTTEIKEVSRQSASSAKETADDLKDVQNSIDNDSDRTRMYTNSIGNYTNVMSSVAEAMRSFVTTLSAARTSGGVSNYDNSTKTQNVKVEIQSAAQSVGQLANRVVKAISSKL